MRPVACAVLAALALASTPPLGILMAQTVPQSGQDHPSPAAAANQRRGMQGGMMCGDMKAMMSKTHDTARTQSGTMASRIEASIVKHKAELGITDAQSASWDRFADALRTAAKATDSARRQMMQQPDTTLSGRLARQEEMLVAHLSSLRIVKDAFGPLYASLDEEQRKVADGICVAPMGVM